MFKVSAYDCEVAVHAKGAINLGKALSSTLPMQGPLLLRFIFQLVSDVALAKKLKDSSGEQVDQIVALCNSADDACDIAIAAEAIGFRCQIVTASQEDTVRFNEWLAILRHRD